MSQVNPTHVLLTLTPTLNTPYLPRYPSTSPFQRESEARERIPCSSDSPQVHCVHLPCHTSGALPEMRLGSIRRHTRDGSRLTVLTRAPEGISGVTEFSPQSPETTYTPNRRIPVGPFETEFKETPVFNEHRLCVPWSLFLVDFDRNLVLRLVLVDTSWSHGGTVW